MPTFLTNNIMYILYQDLFFKTKTPAATGANVGLQYYKLKLHDYYITCSPKLTVFSGIFIPKIIGGVYENRRCIHQSKYR